VRLSRQARSPQRHIYHLKTIYKKNDLFSCDRKIVNDEGFRRLFLDMLVNDQDVQRTVDDNLITTVTQTKNVLNTNNNSIVNTIRSLSSN
jgi:hypothetical protein